MISNKTLYIIAGIGIGILFTILRYVDLSVFYFNANVLAGLMWGVLYYTLDQKQLVPQNERRILSLRELIFPSIERVLSSQVFIVLNILLGVILFFIFYLPNSFWGYKFGYIDSHIIITLLGGIYGIYFSLIFSKIDYIIDWNGKKRLFGLSCFILLSFLLAHLTTGLTFSSTPFFIVGIVSRVGLSLLKLQFEDKVLDSILVNLIKSILIPLIVITVLFFL